MRPTELYEREGADRSPPEPMHPVLAALAERPPRARIALVIEGGGMRGAVTGGMTWALSELGLTGSFDAVYGASAGALNGLWLIAGQAALGAESWGDAAWLRDLIRRRRALAGRPIVAISELITERYEAIAPGLFADALAARAELHPLATDVASGRPVDLHSLIEDEPTLRAALRATSMLPLLAGPPVALGGRRFVDAGLSAAIPIRAALADRPTHVLVLRSRRAGEMTAAPGGLGGALTARLLGRVGPQVAAAFLGRAAGELEDEALLARHADDPDLRFHGERTGDGDGSAGEVGPGGGDGSPDEVGSGASILSIRPAAGSAVPSRLERDITVIRAGLEAGRVAVHAALG